MFVGTAIAGALGDLIGSLPLMNAAAVIYLIAGGLAWKLLAWFEGVEPDVLVTGKGLSGGVYPIAAAVKRSRAGGRN